MATIRQGNRGVLIIVDVQVGVMRNSWHVPQIIENIRTAVDKARRLGVPVIWVQHSDNDLVIDSADWQLVPELVPTNNETRIQKHFNSSFEQTTLEEILAHLGATRIILAGAQTNWCIRATAYGALERGYDLTLIQDAHTTETMELENGVRIEAETIIRELNIAMKWLAYPGRKNDTALAGNIDFSLAGNPHLS